MCIYRERVNISNLSFKELIAALLGCSLFCLFPDRPANLPMINFDQLFETLCFRKRNHLNKIWCICRYFDKISSDMPTGTVSFKRTVLPLEVDLIPGLDFVSRIDTPLCEFKVHTSGLIEDQPHEAVEVFFSGKKLGGDALGKGTSQEEIRFMLCPELIAGMLFLPDMADNETIEIDGAEWFSSYRGYASSFRYSGVLMDRRDVETLGRWKTRIVAVNDLCIPEMREYTKDTFLCEIYKASHLFGYQSYPFGIEKRDNTVVAIGDCEFDAFGKDPGISAIIKWLAASLGNRSFIVYCTFGLEALQNLGKVAALISSQSWTVRHLLDQLTAYSNYGSKGDSFFQWLLNWFLPMSAHCGERDLNVIRSKRKNAPTTLRREPQFFLLDDVSERERESSIMEDFLSYLPPLVKCSSSLSWPLEVERILKNVQDGLLESGKDLVKVIHDLKDALYSFETSSDLRGFIFFFDQVMSREESSKWFSEVVPALAKLLLKLPSLLEAHCENANMDKHGARATVITALRILESQEPGVVWLSQELIAALLGCSLFCLFPVNAMLANHPPVINFDQLFASLSDCHFHFIAQEDKIWCLIRYFERVSSDMPKGTVSFKRRVLLNDANFWSDSAIPLCKFEVHTSGRLEDQSSRAVEVYFAGKVFGENALGSGTSKEDLHFMLSPELIAGMLFLPAIADNEAIEIVGAEWFSTYRGYTSSFRHSGDHVDETDTDTIKGRKTRIVVVNELCFPEMREHTADIFLREINKSLCGFVYHGRGLGNDIGVATGALFSIKDPVINAIIQWLAASQAQRPFISYFTYGYHRLQNLDKVINLISSHASTVGDLWNMLIEYLKGEINVGFSQWLYLSKEK